MSTTWESDEAVFHLFRSSSGQPADTNTWMASSCQVRDPAPTKNVLTRSAGVPSSTSSGANEALVSYWPLAVGIIIIV